MRAPSVMRLPTNSPARKNPVRFSLRTLFVIVLLSAIATWWILIPTQKVKWFANAVNNGESDAAKMMVKPFEKDESWRRSLVQHLANGQRVKAIHSKTEVSIAPVSFADIVFGERRFTVVQGHDVETADGSRQYGYSTVNGTMTRKGIRQK